MSKAKRIYAVFQSGDVEAQALIRAATRSQALAHYTKRNLVVDVASQDDLIDATKQGLEVEEANTDDESLAADPTLAPELA